MKFRKLRIAWSVAWGVACVLLIVLWIRSYLVSEGFFGTVPQIGFELSSERGSLNMVFPLDALWLMPFTDWEYRRFDFGPGTTEWLPKCHTDKFGTFLDLPYWTLVLSSGILAATIWVRWSKRFTLRTLLIATTLVAVVLGLVMWAASK